MLFCYHPRPRWSRGQGVSNKDILQVQVRINNWLVSQCTGRNQLPVIKPSAYATICDVIGYFREIDLNLVW